MSRYGQKLRSEVADLRSELKSDMRSLRADVASDVLTLRKELGEQITGLRRAVIEYHTSVIGHGVLISDLDARVRRVEQHLNLPPLEGDLSGDVSRRAVGGRPGLRAPLLDELHRNHRPLVEGEHR